MSEFRQKNKLKKFIKSPFMIIVFLIVLIVITKAVFGVYTKERLSSDNLERQQMELEKLSVREKELAQSINYLKTDDGVESEIRTKFRLAKDGESIAVIVDNEASNTLDKTRANTATSSPGFWRRLFDWF